MRPANERQRYNVTLSLIGWAHRQNDPCVCVFFVSVSCWFIHTLQLSCNITLCLHYPVFLQADSKLRALSASYRLKKPDRRFEEMRNYSNELQTHVTNILKTRAVSLLLYLSYLVLIFLVLNLFHEIYIYLYIYKILHCLSVYPWPERSKGYCHCLCLSVCLSACELYFVCTITRHWFGLELPNLHQTCSMGHPRLVCDLDLQGILAILTRNSKKFWLVSAITCDGFELESPNLPQICILGFSGLILKMGFIDLDLQGHLAMSTQNSKKRHSSSLSSTDLGRPMHASLGCYMWKHAHVQHWVLLRSLLFQHQKG